MWTQSRQRSEAKIGRRGASQQVEVHSWCSNYTEMYNGKHIYISSKFLINLKWGKLKLVPALDMVSSTLECLAYRLRPRRHLLQNLWSVTRGCRTHPSYCEYISLSRKEVVQLDNTGEGSWCFVQETRLFHSHPQSYVKLSCRSVPCVYVRA